MILYLFSPLQGQYVADAGRKLIRAVADIQEGPGGMLHDAVHDAKEMRCLPVVQALTGFIQDEHGGILYERPCQQGHALPSNGQILYPLPSEGRQFKDLHPLFHHHRLPGGNAPVQAGSIEKTGGNRILAGCLLVKVPM